MTVTNTCKRCETPIPRRKQFCKDCYRGGSAKPLKTCARCTKQFRGRPNTKYCSAFCRNEQNILDKLARSGTEIVTEKTCSSCKVTKPAFKFVPSGYSKDGIRSRCRDCDKEKNRKWREITPDYKERARENNLQRNFGISVAEYEALLKFQGNACAICGSPPPEEGKKRFAVDHDHATGEIRGLACLIKCNKLMIGYHTVETAKRVLAYLENPPARDFFGGVKIAERSKNTGRRRNITLHPLPKR